MTASNGSDTSSCHEPLIADHRPPQYIVVVPPYLPRYRRRRRLREACLRREIVLTVLLLLLGSAAYVLWPSDPELSVARLDLHRFNFRTYPQISLDVTLDLAIKVWNKDFYSIDYDSLLVAISYRGERLGYMSSDGGSIKSRRTSYINGTLRLDGVEMLSDAIYLIEDLAKGAITFDTVSEIRGKIGLYFFDIPLKAKISCEIIVSTSNQTIAHQNCYPKA